jgi:hypothetical protein
LDTLVGINALDGRGPATTAGEVSCFNISGALLKEAIIHYQTSFDIKLKRYHTSIFGT